MRRVALTLAVVTLSLTALSGQDRRPTPNGPSAPARRLALVIGNDTYAGSPLRNARNDARAMERALRGLSFEVTVLEDGTRSSMLATVLAFSQRVLSTDVAVIFYAGHGQQVESVNYLIPVDYQGRSEDELRAYAVSSDEMTRALRRAGVGVLVLDACRDNPYSGSRSGGRGLAPLQVPGLLVAFSASAGQTAGDSPGATNSVYTTELLQVLGTPGLSLLATFNEVGRRVRGKTDRRQSPAYYTELDDDPILRPAAAAPAPAPASTAASPADLVLRAELELWDAIKNSTNAALFADYVKRYPNGQFRAVAETRVPRLAMETIEERLARHDLETAAAARSEGTARISRVDARPMAWIPPGTFQMGSPNSQANRGTDETLHRVDIGEGFWMDTTEVTNAAYQRFVQDQPSWSRSRLDPITGDGDYLKHWSGDRPPSGKGDHPVTWVSWFGARAFCSWAGKRLLTEAEWEYAARAGTKTAYWWGDAFDGTRANNNRRGAEPVGRGRRVNQWRLADVAGNVWEWTSTRMLTYPYRTDDGREDQIVRADDRRVLRGGSAYNPPQNLRSAYRFSSDPRGTYAFGGFRCVQSGQ